MSGEMICEVCDGLGCSECCPDLNLGRPDPHTLAVAAADENGTVVVKVWCAECSATRTPVAVVRRSSAGLVFVGAGPPLGGDRDGLVGLYRLRWRRRLEIPLIRSRIVVLLEHPDDPPEAWCSEHGRIEASKAELVATAGRHRLRRGPLNLRYPPTAQSGAGKV